MMLLSFLRFCTTFVRRMNCLFVPFKEAVASDWKQAELASLIFKRSCSGTISVTVHSTLLTRPINKRLLFILWLNWCLGIDAKFCFWCQTRSNESKLMKFYCLKWSENLGFSTIFRRTKYYYSFGSRNKIWQRSLQRLSDTKKLFYVAAITSPMSGALLHALSRSC